MLKLPNGAKKQSVGEKLILRLRDVPQAQPALSSGQWGQWVSIKFAQQSHDNAIERLNRMEQHLAANQDHALLARCAFAGRLLLQLQIAMNDKPGGKKKEEKLNHGRLWFDWTLQPIFFSTGQRSQIMSNCSLHDIRMAHVLSITKSSQQGVLSWWLVDSSQVAKCSAIAACTREFSWSLATSCTADHGAMYGYAWPCNLCNDVRTPLWSVCCQKTATFYPSSDLSFGLQARLLRQLENPLGISTSKWGPKTRELKMDWNNFEKKNKYYILPS